jgi:acyl carrier protein
MELDAFIKKFTEQFEDAPVEEFTAETEFKMFPEWDSLTSLTIIAMVDEEYGVSIKGEDIREADTIQELFEIVKSK